MMRRFLMMLNDSGSLLVLNVGRRKTLLRRMGVMLGPLAANDELSTTSECDGFGHSGDILAVESILIYLGDIRNVTGRR